MLIRNQICKPFYDKESYHRQYLDLTSMLSKNSFLLTIDCLLEKSHVINLSLPSFYNYLVNRNDYKARTPTIMH